MQNGKVTNSGDDSQAYPVVQVKYKGNVVDALKMLPYPLVGSPLAGAEVTLIDTNGHESQKVAIAHEPKRRLKGFKAGEGGIQNIVSGNYVLMFNDGDTQTYTKRDLIAEITRDVIATFVNMNLTGTLITINADIDFTGNVNGTGDVTITGDVNTTGALNNNTKAVGSTHTHGGVTAGGANTAVPN